MNAAASQPQPSGYTQPYTYNQHFTQVDDDNKQEAQSLNEYETVTSDPTGDPSDDPKDHSTAGSPDDSKDLAKRAAEKFPETWIEDEPFLNIFFIATVEDATWITREIYKEIDKGTISASLYTERSENCVQIGGPLISRAKGKKSNEARSNLIKEIKNKLKGIFGL